MNFGDMVRAISIVLNGVLFGARVESDPDVVSQWATIAVSYMLNLAIVFLVVAAGFTISGYYQPFVTPLAGTAVQLLVAIANLLTIALTYYCVADMADAVRCAIANVPPCLAI